MLEYCYLVFNSIRSSSWSSILNCRLKSRNVSVKKPLTGRSCKCTYTGSLYFPHLRLLSDLSGHRHIQNISVLRKELWKKLLLRASLGFSCDPQTQQGADTNPPPPRTDSHSPSPRRAPPALPLTKPRTHTPSSRLPPGANRLRGASPGAAALPQYRCPPPGRVWPPRPPPSSPARSPRLPFRAVPCRSSPCRSAPKRSGAHLCSFTTIPNQCLILGFGVPLSRNVRCQPRCLPSAGLLDGPEHLGNSQNPGGDC